MDPETEEFNADGSGSSWFNETGDWLWNTTTNASLIKNSSELELPIDMKFNDGHLLSIIAYSILMFFSAIGNLSVLNSMIKIRMKARLNRVNLLLLHLAIADLFVTFLMMPLEIGWNVTVSWQAGDFMCRLMSFFRTFGIYLSGFIIVCISLDRYFAVLQPMTLPEANRRSRIMLYTAYTAAFLCSLPQSWVFHLESHPVFTWYEQCITHNSFGSKASELIYNFFGFTLMYGFPMLMIIFCYFSILFEIYKVNRLRRNGDELRRSSTEALSRAKKRTLSMTVVIVVTFALLWSPYNVMSLWYWFDKESARTVDHRIQKCLFIFACTNSCVNPLIYGLFHIQNHHQSKRESQQRQNLLMANNYRMQRLDRPPYGVRVRWKPRDCLCPAGTSGTSSSSDRKANKFPIQHANGNGKIVNEGFRRATQNTRSTAVDGCCGSQRRGRTANLIPLTSREFQRHLPTVSSDALGLHGGGVVLRGIDTTSFIHPLNYRNPSVDNNVPVHSSRRSCAILNNSTSSITTCVQVVQSQIENSPLPQLSNGQSL